MKPSPFPGSYWIANNLLIGDAGTNIQELAATAVELLFDAGVRCVVHLLSKEQFLAAGPDGLFGALGDVLLEGPDFGHPPKLELHYCFWPLADETQPTERQIRAVMDTIEQAHRVGLSVFLDGTGNPARAKIAADCWLARHGV